MKLQKIVSHLQKLHPKEIDLSLDRVKNLCEKKLGNPQDKIKDVKNEKIKKSLTELTRVFKEK